MTSPPPCVRPCDAYLDLYIKSSYWVDISMTPPRPPLHAYRNGHGEWTPAPFERTPARDGAALKIDIKFPVLGFLMEAELTGYDLKRRF